LLDAPGADDKSSLPLGGIERAVTLEQCVAVAPGDRRQDRRRYQDARFEGVTGQIVGATGARHRQRGESRGMANYIARPVVAMDVIVVDRAEKSPTAN
jgi:hypothetical protein